MLPKIDDAPGVAIYADPPYLAETIGASKYVHDFTVADHAKLAEQLRRFTAARVVVSYYASPKLAVLYPGWTQIDCSRHKHLHVQNKRGSTRSEAPEVLLVNGSAFESAKLAEDLFADVN